jgi:hypothetical protein
MKQRIVADVQPARRDKRGLLRQAERVLLLYQR